MEERKQIVLRSGLLAVLCKIEVGIKNHANHFLLTGSTEEITERVGSELRSSIWELNRLTDHLEDKSTRCFHGSFWQLKILIVS